MDRRIAAAVFTLVFFAYAYFFGGGGSNQNAVFDTTRALVEQRTFSIDAYRANTGDTSTHDGRVFANKAPGTALLAVPVYAAAYVAEHSIGANVNSFAIKTLNQYLCTVAVCGGSGALLAVLVFLYARRLGASPRHAVSGALVVAFATYVFAYSTVLFVHVPSALLLFGAWVFRDHPIGAGALGGAAVVCNYAVVFPLAVIVLVIGWRRWQALGAAITGGLPFAGGLLLYQALCFGSPFRTSIATENPIFHTSGAVYGVLVAPTLEALSGITVSRYRGLFFLSPVLILAFAGAVIMLRRRDMVRELIVAAGVFSTLLALNLTFNAWHGGWAIGPRYLLPVVPFLIIPVLFAMRYWPVLAALLAAVSFVFNFAVTAVLPTPPTQLADPIFGYTLPLLFTGHGPGPLGEVIAERLGRVSVNAASVDEEGAFVRYAPGSLESRWASFNLGELFWPGSPISLLPILIWIVGGSALLLRAAPAAESGDATEARGVA